MVDEIRLQWAEVDDGERGKRYVLHPNPEEAERSALSGGGDLPRVPRRLTLLIRSGDAYDAVGVVQTASDLAHAHNREPDTAENPAPARNRIYFRSVSNTTMCVQRRFEFFERICRQISLENIHGSPISANFPLVQPNNSVAPFGNDIF